MSISAKDVQALRQATGAGMMDAKRALEETGGDFDAAAKSLREKGLAKSVDRSDRENTQGAVAVGVRRRRRRHRRAQVRDRLRRQVRRLPRGPRPAHRRGRRRRRGRHRGAAGQGRRPEGHAQGEHRRRARRPHRRGRRPGGRHLPAQAGGPRRQRGHRRARRRRRRAGPRDRGARGLHQAALPVPRRGRPPADADEERSTLEGITRAEGKPEQAIEKIVDGRLNAWYKEQVLLEQPFVRDDKQTITQLLGDASIARFAQVYIGS